MEPDRHSRHQRRLSAAAAALLACAALAACGERRQPAPELDPAAVTPPTDPAAALSAPAPATPSYEVSIATAAAERNHAVADCGTRPQAERQPCVDAALERFRATRAELENSRAEQP